MPDIVCFYADLGRDYEPLLTRMVASAKKVMPDARVICATSAPNGKIGKGWDLVAELTHEITLHNLCRERARLTVSWALSATEPMIFADPDIEFRNPISFDTLSDVNLIWRNGKIDQPINGGLVIAKPGPQKFWWHYGQIVVNLPDVLQGWWCDQLAFNILTGSCHEAGDILRLDDADVQLIDGRKFCPKSDAQTIPSEAWAIHYKGPRKGPGWDKIFIPKKNKPSGPKSTSGGGTSLQGSVSSTGIVAAQSLESQPEDSRSISVRTYQPSP